MRRTNNQSLESKLRNALLDLLQKKRFEDISVKALCHDVGINRTSFYLCFTNKSELLHYSCECFLVPFIRTFDETLSFDAEDFQKKITLSLTQNQSLMPIFNKLIQIKAIDFDPEIVIQNSVETSLKKLLKGHASQPMIDFYTEDFAISLICTLKWWLKYPNVTPCEVSHMIYLACFKGLNQIIS